MRIVGEILEFDGQPASEPSVSAVLRDNNFVEPIEVTTNGHRYEAWLPVHRFDWHSVRFQVKSNDGKRRASINLMRPYIRQRAIDGLNFSLQPSTRSVEVKVVHDGAPVADAYIRVETNDGAILDLQSDQTGSAWVRLLPNETLERFTAWTEKPLRFEFCIGQKTKNGPPSTDSTCHLATQSKPMPMASAFFPTCRWVLISRSLPIHRPNVAIIGWVL